MMFRSNRTEEMSSSLHEQKDIFSQLLPPEQLFEYSPIQPNDDEFEISNDEIEMNVGQKTEIELVDENGNVTLAKSCFKASDVYKLAKGLKIFVHVNNFGQPNRSSRRILTRFMPKLIQEPHLCPPDITSFNDVKNAFGVELIRAVRDKFCFPNNDRVDNVLLSMMDSKFRNNKYRIRKHACNEALTRLREKFRNFLEGNDLTHAELEQRVRQHEFREDQIFSELDLMGPPPGFANHQWLQFKNVMKSEKFKKLSKKGKTARAAFCHNHTTGTKSFAQIEDEHVRIHKERPGPISFFDMTHKKKDGSYVKDKSKDFMMTAKSEIRKRKASGTCEDSAELERDVWTELMGEDKPGRARGYGTGVTKSLVNGFRAKLRRMRNESEAVARDADLTKLREQMTEQQQQLVAQQKAMNEYMLKTNEIIANLKGEVLVYRTAFGAPASEAFEAPSTSGTNYQNVC